MKSKSLNINDLSKHLFWDVDVKDFDMEKNFRFILQRVLQYGLMEDWLLIYREFGLARITKEAKLIRSLDKKSMHFIAAISDSKIEDFVCYTFNQSIPQHWNF